MARTSKRLPSEMVVADQELQLAQKSLRTSERLLQTIIDNSPSVIFLKDTEGRYLLVNKRFEAIAGKSREQIIGRLDEDVFPPAEATAFRKNDREVLIAGIPLQFEESVLTERGTVWSVVEKFPLFDGKGTIFATGGIATDISDRKKALRQLEIAEYKSRLILDSALDAVVTIDAAGRITDWNKQAENIFGWSKDEIAGKKLSDTIIPQSFRMDHETGLKNFLVTGHGSILNRRLEVMALHRDGFEFPIELTVTPVQVEGEWTFTAFIRDLTERQVTEEALRMAHDELARMSRLTAMGQLSAAIAHEINQPLTAIVTNSETCLRWLNHGDRNLEKAAAAAQRTARDAVHAGEIVAHIRSLMNKTPGEKSPLDINTLIRKVLDLTQSEMLRQQVSVQSDLADPVPPILGDRIQLQQVILNLILNSIEAMAVVHERPRTLVIKSVFSRPNWITVTLQDSGTGIDPTVIDRIFDAFFSTKTNGTGMGLSICRSIIEAHDGELSAIPGIPYGAVFQFKLPSVTTMDS